MLCKKCGKRIEADSKCCGKCGERVVLSGVSVLEISAAAEESAIKTVMPAPPVAPAPVAEKGKRKPMKWILVIVIIIAVIAGALVFLASLGRTKNDAPPPASSVPQEQKIAEESILQKAAEAWMKNEVFSMQQTAETSYTIENTKIAKKTIADTVTNAQLTRSEVIKTEDESETHILYYTDSSSGFQNLYMQKDGVWSTQAVEELPNTIIGIAEKETVLLYLTEMQEEKKEEHDTQIRMQGVLNAKGMEVVLKRLCPNLLDECLKADASENTIAHLLQELPKVKIKVVLEKETNLPISLELEAADTVSALEKKLGVSAEQKENLLTEENNIIIQVMYQEAESIELPVEADQAQNGEIVRRDDE